jgi:hypothetical protein
MAGILSGGVSSDGGGRIVFLRLGRLSGSVLDSALAHHTELLLC